jgi:hypothetical protein
MKAQFVYESLNEFYLFKNQKKEKAKRIARANEMRWGTNFSNEKTIDMIDYHGIPIKIVKIGEYPQKYYAVLPMKRFGLYKPMPYYSARAALHSTKGYLHTYFLKLRESFKNKKMNKDLNEDLNMLGYLSIGYLSGFLLSQILKWVKKQIKKSDEFYKSEETINDLINLINKKDKFTITEYNDRYFITPASKYLKKEIGDIRIFKNKPIINVKNYDLILLPNEHSKLLNIMKKNISENMQTPLSNDDKNQSISQKYPLENPNYLGDSSGDDKEHKKKHIVLKRRIKR